MQEIDRWGPNSARPKQRCSGCFESPSEKVGHADPHERVGLVLARIEAQRCLEMLNRRIGLSGPCPQPAAPLPTAGKARIELQSAVEQTNGNIDFLDSAAGLRIGAGLLFGRSPGPGTGASVVSPRELFEAAFLRLSR